MIDIRIHMCTSFCYSKKNRLDSTMYGMSLYEERIPHVRRIPHGHLAKDMLRYLALGAAVYIVLSSPQGTRKFLKGIKKEWRKRDAKRTLERLKQHKLISYKEAGNNTFAVTITQAGRKKVKEWDFEALAIEKPATWDGRWRIVTFDIAEVRKRGRDALRGMLRQLGFFQLQRSIFVHPYSCKAEIELLRDVFSLPEKEVLYFSADRVPNELALKKKFKLH